LLPGIGRIISLYRPCEQRGGNNERQSPQLHGFGLSGTKRRTIAARINSAIQPTTKARAGLIVTVTKA
jgi:hypothetical protein